MAKTNPSSRSEDEFAQRRLCMVREQIEQRDVKDGQVLSAMREVPRHLFVPAAFGAFAYDDQPLPIGRGQTISQPFMVAYMAQTLNLRNSSRVLEIGTGSGYQAAVLSRICEQVFTVEIHEELSRRARKVFATLGYANIHVHIGDGYEGWPEHAPYDGIIVTCAPSHIPQPLTEQLAEGGRMVIPLGLVGDVQELYVMVKQQGRIVRHAQFEVRFVPMTGSSGKVY